MVVGDAGIKRWYKDDVLHRDDGPALVWERNGVERWYKNGKMHRLDGPASMCSRNGNSWWVDGIRCTSHKQFQEMSGLSTDEVIMLAMRWGDISGD